MARILKANIQVQGPLTFQAFMTAALYDPHYGFYTKGPSLGVPGGTFSTNALYPAFAFAWAQAINNAERKLGIPLRIVELGGGTGELGRRIKTFLHEPHEYVVVESSVGLQRKQLVQGLQSVHTMTVLPPMPSCVFGNELLDALPVNRVMGEDHGNLVEMYISLDEHNEFIECFAELSTPALADRLVGEGVTLGRGQLAEICLAYEELLEGLAKVVSQGYLIFIDYGDEATTLYHFSKRNGTLRTFMAQSETHDPFDCVGDQDITANVDFTAVVSCARKAGWDYVGTIPQGTWLNAIGITQFLALAHDYPEAQEEIIQLTHPARLGSAFDVIAFKTPGLPNPPGFL